MTSISELSNTPRRVTIGKLSLRLRQLKLKELFSYFEQRIKDRKIKEAQEMTQYMDAEDRKGFMVDVWKNLPSGEELTDLITDFITSIDGIYDIIYLAARDFEEDITVEKISEAIDLSDLDSIAPLIKWVSGTESFEDKKNEEGEELVVEDSAEKKTA